MRTISLPDGTPAQVCLAWVRRQPDVLAVPKAGDEAHLRANAAALDGRLDDRDLPAIDASKHPLAML